MEVTLNISTLAFIIFGAAFFTLIIFSLIFAGRETLNDDQDYFLKKKKSNH